MNTTATRNRGSAASPLWRALALVGGMFLALFLLVTWGAPLAANAAEPVSTVVVSEAADLSSFNGSVGESRAGAHDSRAEADLFAGVALAGALGIGILGALLVAKSQRRLAR